MMKEFDVRMPQKVYFQAGETIYRVSNKHKEGVTRNGKRWWSDRVWSLDHKQYIIFLADNADELTTPFRYYRLTEVGVEVGLRRQMSGQGYRLDHTFVARVEPFDPVMEGYDEGVTDEELGAEGFDFIEKPLDGEALKY